MASFETSDIPGKIRPAFRASQKTIERLESISSVDLAMAQPYLRITQINPVTRKPIEGLPPINAFFTKPHAFGTSIQQTDAAGNTTVMGERPPVSLEKVTVKTKQNYGQLLEEHLEFDIMVHRPDAVFGSRDSGWASLITPGREHLLEYGWTGSSKNDLVNGRGLKDEETQTFINSKRSLIFTTSFYTFQIQENGQIKLKIKAYNNGQFMLRNISVMDVPEVHDLINKGNPDNDIRVPQSWVPNKIMMKKIKSRIQSKLNDLTRQSKNTITFKEIADAFVAPTIETMGKLWGYNEFIFQFANFNATAGPTRRGKKIKAGFGIDYSDKSIGSFKFSLSDVKKKITSLYSKNTKMNMGNFLSIFATIVNSSGNWKGNKKFDRQLPNIKIKVGETTIRGKKTLSIIIFDQWTEVKSLRNTGLLLPKEQTRENIKRKITEANVPFITLGKGFSYIKNGRFEAIMDNQIARVKIIAAAGTEKNRFEYLKKSQEAFERGMPDPFHEVFASALKGEITLLGNFALDTFALIWIDFRAQIWSGPFTIQEREDTITRASFLTKLKVYGEGSDPLNTRRRLTEKQLKDREEAKKKKFDAARKKQRKKRRGKKKSQTVEQQQATIKNLRSK